MKTLQICFLGTKQSGKTTVARKLHQKAEFSEDDFSVYSFKQGDALVYLLDPIYSSENIKPVLASMEEADGCVLCVSAIEGITPSLGEIIIMLNAKGIEKGVIAITKVDSAPENVDKIQAQLKAILKDSTMKEYSFVSTSSITDEGFTDIREALVTFAPKHKDASKPFKMEIESTREIKSGITGVTGMILSGSLKKYDKTYMLPWGKDFIVQEIYVEGLLVENAHAGQRADIVFKGLNKWDVHMGDVAAATVSHKGNVVKVDFKISPFFKDELRPESEVHLNIGMQTLPVVIKSISKGGAPVDKLATGESGLISLESKLPFAFEANQTAVIYNPNAHWKSIKMAGSGKVVL